MAAGNLLHSQGSQPAPRLRGRAARAKSSHNVQFYEGEEFLVHSVADYIAQGLNAGQLIMVISSSAHRSAFTRALAAMGFDVAAAIERAQLVYLDASQTLAQFMTDGMPDPVRFRQAIEPVVRRAEAPPSPVHLRAYGEMVDLLASDGNLKASIRLEELWNDLVDVHDFDLLCGYAMSSFAMASDALGFQEICRLHSHVAPTERYTQAEDSERSREISRLQQRALALENEIARREQLEQRLHEALEEKDRSLRSERVARTEAETANRAKNQFLAVMSHELRTPLNAIAGHAQLLELGLHGPITSAQQDALSRIGRNQRHLLSLVNDVLNLAHVDSGREEYRIEKVELAPLVEAIVSMIEPLLTSGRLSFGVADQLREMPSVVVLADFEKVQQILLNLLTNAIKFTAAGGRVTIGAYVDNAARMAFVEVRDTGVGISAENTETVFEPFVQLSTRLSRRQDGIGLGLTISRRYARAMQGDLTVTSGTGEGACFRLALPMAPAAAR